MKFIAVLDALVADVGRLLAHAPFDEVAHLVARLATKGAVQGFFAQGVLLVGHEGVLKEGGKKT